MPPKKLAHQRRPSATGPLHVRPGSGDAARMVMGERLRWGLEVLREHEHHRLAAGTTAHPWLTSRLGSQVMASIERAVDAAVALRHAEDFHEGAFSTMHRTAQEAGINRRHLLDGFGAGVQPVPAITAAGFTVDGLLGPFGAYMAFEHSGSPGRSNHAVGTHKAEGRRPIERVLGVAGVGVDTLVPVTAHALLTDTDDDPRVAADPERQATVQEALAEWGMAPMSTVGDHLTQHLAVLNDARAALMSAAQHGSRGSRMAGIDPRDALRRGMPRWLLAGPMQTGPLTDLQHATAGTLLLPGLDAGMFAAAQTARMRPLFWAGSGHPGSTGTAPFENLLYQEDNWLMGHRLSDALLGADRDAIPTLRELSGPARQLVAEQALAAGVPLDPMVRYLVVPTGLVLTSDSKPIPVGAVIRIDLTRTIVWLTTVDLNKHDIVAHAVQLAELHLRALERPVLSRCVQRYATDHDLHTNQASSYQTRTAMRIAMMLANLAVVAVGRLRQGA